MADIEAVRDANIRANRELLVSLGLDSTKTIPSQIKAKKGLKGASLQSKKRKSSVLVDEEDLPPKSIKVESASGSSDVSHVRRSTRSASKRINYDESTASNESIAKSRRPRLVSSSAIIESGREHVGNRLGTRIHDPKTFGAIPGVEVGTWWETRAACSTDAVHAPFVAGIAGSATDGAYSVALSGGYDDDVDLGYGFTYTGSGGRDLKGTSQNPKNLRTAPQSFDQTFENSMNAALKKSSETKKPVRVIRGFKLRSPYAPDSGYRYDGLYTVEKAWLERGLNKQGYLVCKYAFRRIHGQPPLPRKAEGDDSEEPHEMQSTDEDGKESSNEEPI